MSWELKEFLILIVVVPVTSGLSAAAILMYFFSFSTHVLITCLISSFLSSTIMEKHLYIMLFGQKVDYNWPTISKDEVKEWCKVNKIKCHIQIGTAYFITKKSAAYFKLVWG